MKITLTPTEVAIIVHLIKQELAHGPLGKGDDHWPGFAKELRQLQKKLK